MISLADKNAAYLRVLGLNVRDILIKGEHLEGAMEGDMVIAKRLLGVRGAPQAKVVLIAGREKSYSIAILHEGKLLDLQNSFAIPLKTPYELSSHKEGDLFQVCNQERRVIKLLGNMEDPGVDEKIVFAKYNRSLHFTEEVLKEARAFPKNVDASMYSDRKDLRALNFCTIDPDTAKDFDDAIYFDAEHSKLFVAIADVSTYVTLSSAIDSEAQERGFSVYLPHKAIPMLPRELSETLCSLVPYQDRLAYVFEMELDKKTFEVTKSYLYEALIHSKRRFTYSEVDALFEGNLNPTNDAEHAIFPMLLKLSKVTERLKEKRMKEGYEFKSPDLRIVIDENATLVSTYFEEDTPSHALIEDCMLLANKEAASRYEKGVFRSHESPSQAKLQQLYHELSGIGIEIIPKATLKETITSIQQQAKIKKIEKEVDTMIIRAQMQAQYTAENYGHFGLGFERYTHFTSPIRRYSDLTIHRLLKALAKNDTHESSYVLRNIDALCVNISDKEREADSIEQNYKQRKFARWAKEHIGESFKSIVIATESQLSVELEDEICGIKIKVTTDMPVVLFDRVYVRIDASDLISAQIAGHITGRIVDDETA